ncbi:hypothetical protein IOLA_287 [uncultured bacterium]|nr:hypothetical protein IOLA_287 [uncultured bacterium]
MTAQENRNNTQLSCFEINLSSFRGYDQISSQKRSELRHTNFDLLLKSNLARLFACKLISKTPEKSELVLEKIKTCLRTSWNSKLRSNTLQEVLNLFTSTILTTALDFLTPITTISKSGHICVRPKLCLPVIFETERYFEEFTDIKENKYTRINVAKTISSVLTLSSTIVIMSYAFWEKHNVDTLALEEAIDLYARAILDRCCTDHELIILLQNMLVISRDMLEQCNAIKENDESFDADKEAMKTALLSMKNRCEEGIRSKSVELSVIVSMLLQSCSTVDRSIIQSLLDVVYKAPQINIQQYINILDIVYQRVIEGSRNDVSISQLYEDFITDAKVNKRMLLNSSSNILKTSHKVISSLGFLMEVAQAVSLSFDNKETLSGEVMELVVDNGQFTVYDFAKSSHSYLYLFGYGAVKFTKSVLEAYSAYSDVKKSRQCIIEDYHKYVYRLIKSAKNGIDLVLKSSNVLHSLEMSLKNLYVEREKCLAELSGSISQKSISAENALLEAILDYISIKEKILSNIVANTINYKNLQVDSGYIYKTCVENDILVTSGIFE